jgi:glycosyltransferase involved in cell wall biosynthesis
VSTTTSLRIAIVLKTNQGGLWILPQIGELLRRGHQVTVVLPSGRGRLRDALDRLDVAVIESAFDFSFRPGRSTLRRLLALRRQLASSRPDAVFYHLYASALAARAATLGRGVPRIHMVAGPLYLESRLIRAAERWLCRLDHLVICGSEHIEGLYRGLGLAVGKTLTVPYGVDSRHFTPPTAETRLAARRALGLPADAFVVIMVAYVYAPKRMVHAGAAIKGHDVVLRAWSTFRRAHPDAVLLLVGGGFDAAGEDHRTGLVRQFATDSPTSGVRWVDTVSDVRPYYATADLSVCPSRSENHGAALESAAMAVPLIVSDAGGLPETVDASTGWIVPKGDAAALATALDCAYSDRSRDLLSARGGRGRERTVSIFDQNVCAGRVAAAIEATAATPGRRGGTGAPGRRPVPGSVTIFTEARFGQDPCGRWAAQDAANGAASWEPYREQFDPVTVVGRARPVAGTADVELGQVDLMPIPYYVGARELVLRSPAVWVAIARAVRQAATIVVRLPGPVGTIAAAVCIARRRPYAVEVVGDPRDVLDAGVAGRTGRLAAGLAARLMRWQVRRAAASWYVTTETLQRRYPPRRGSPSVGMACVKIGDGDLVEAPRKSWECPFTVVAIGSQEQLYKGHDVLLRAVQRLHRAGLPLRARIVGSGRYHRYLAELARDLGLGDQVELLNRIDDRATILKILDDADAFVMPSRTEGLPRSLIEAMARALPAIGSAVGGIPELLDARWLVPVGDDAALAVALEQLMADRAEWVRQSATNLVRARSYHQDVLGPALGRWLADVRGCCATEPGHSR